MYPMYPWYLQMQKYAKFFIIFFHHFRVFPDLIPHNDAVGVGNVAKKRLKRTQQEHILCTEGSMDLTYEGVGWVRHTATLETFCSKFISRNYLLTHQSAKLFFWYQPHHFPGCSIHLCVWKKKRQLPGSVSNFLWNDSCKKSHVEFPNPFCPGGSCRIVAGQGLLLQQHITVECSCQGSFVLVSVAARVEAGQNHHPDMSWSGEMQWEVILFRKAVMGILPQLATVTDGQFFFESILWIHDVLVCTPNLWVHSSLSGLQYI